MSGDTKSGDTKFSTPAIPVGTGAIPAEFRIPEGALVRIWKWNPFPHFTYDPRRKRGQTREYLYGTVVKSGLLFIDVDLEGGDTQEFVWSKDHLWKRFVLELEDGQDKTTGQRLARWTIEPGWWEIKEILPGSVREGDQIGMTSAPARKSSKSSNGETPQPGMVGGTSLLPPIQRFSVPGLHPRFIITPRMTHDSALPWLKRVGTP